MVVPISAQTDDEADMRLRPIAPPLRAAVLRFVIPLWFLAACGPPPELTALAEPQRLPAPTGDGAGEPNLAVLRDGRVLLNWTEDRGDQGHALRYAVLDGLNWSEPHTVAEGTNWFVNWADFPSVIELPDGTFAAHWLVRRDGSRYAYDVAIARSADGVRWSTAVTPHDDMTPTEHGFVSLFPFAGELGAVWLDGRNFAGNASQHDGHGGGADMTLRFARIDADGSVHAPAILDARTCECCQTTAVLTSEGPVVAYRDRSPAEIRDINVVRFAGGSWSEPTVVHADGWELAGCPVNGPMLAANDRTVTIAWFTAAGDEPRVLAAFSHDAAQSFSAPIRIDDGDPLGRIAATVLEDGSAIISWLERTPDAAEIRARRIAPDGRRSAAIVVAVTGAERASGFPRMVRADDRVVFAWTVPGTPRQLHLASAAIP
jgi:hypothetical protein